VDLADLAHRRDTILIDDLGHGCLVDLKPFGLSNMTTVSQSASAGSDVVIFSGDKLLGGPQAGMIVGREALIDRLRRHPLARAMRIDKLSLAALEGTLRSYVDGTWEQLPLYASLGRPLKLVRQEAKRIAAAWPGAVIEKSACEVGGGALPGEGIPTYRVGLTGPDAIGLASRLRRNHPPIVARIERETVWLDARTIAPQERNLVIHALKELR
jgi:L-seryl-tRNA(Ser) seleniumtransferase